MARTTSLPLIQNRQRKYTVSVPRLGRFTAQLLQRLRIPTREFGLLLTNNRRIRRLNRRFRDKDLATDVLSFPAGDREGNHTAFENGYLGDIIISVEKAQQQALERDHPLEREVEILIIHGLLHLMGYDHESDQGQMRRKELKLQRELL